MHQGDARQEGLRQLAVLNRIARIALEDLDLGPMLQRIVDTLHDEFGWEFIAFARVDRERGEFCCEAVHSNADTSIAAGYRRELGSGVVGECALTGRTLDIEDTRTHPNFIDTMPGTRSELCVPISHRGEVLAVLNVESQAPAAFRGQRALLETVADQIAGAIRAANLLSALQLANEELREAYAIVEAMSRNDSLTGIANRRRFDAWFAQAFEDAHAIAERLRMAVRERAMEHRHAAAGWVTISAGVAACIPTDEAVATTLFAAADRALYAAKDAGRNRTMAADAMRMATTP